MAANTSPSTTSTPATAPSAPLNAALDRLEDAGLETDEDALYDAFNDWAEESGRPLYPHQEEALLEILSGNHVIAQTPTGSGKSLIALAGHFISAARGGRSYYTAPLKALVSEKFFDLVDAFGAHNVGMITGDISLNPQAPIICCTAEILANQSLREGADLDADLVVMDEFHFYGDPQRGWAWRIPLLELPNPQFVLLSATLGDTTDLRAELEARTGRETALLSDAERPVPLEFDYLVDELPVVVERLIDEDRAPVYVVHFAQNDAVKTAVDLARTLKVSKEQQRQIRDVLAGQELGRGFGKTLKDLLLKGVGVHHAGMIPRYRRLVERLAQRGLLRVICGTDTLGVGINVPIRTVLFTSLVKYDGRRSRHLSAREFHQIAGRAGRPGFDPVGYVRGIAAEDELEKARHQARMTAAQEAKDAAKQRKLSKRRAPQKKAGEVSWTKGTFNRLQSAGPEVLQPRFQTGHAMVLNVLHGGGDAEGRLLRLAEEGPQTSSAQEDAEASNRHLRNLGDVYRSLVQAELVERVPLPEAAEGGRRTTIRAVGDLPDDFALNQPLAPFALAVLDILDPESPSFAADVISVIEAVMEDPRPLLFAQQRAARDEAFQVMRQDGVDFETRRDLVAEIKWPQPLSEVIMPAFDVFSQTNPWVRHNEPSPKRVLREMVEDGLNFSQLIDRYKLTNSEGVVLRYLSDTYQALRQILPEAFQTEEVTAIIDWLRELLASVDSSLLDEWEDMMEGRLDAARDRDASAQVDATAERAFGASEDGTIEFAVNRQAMRGALRAATFRLVDLAAQDKFDGLTSQALPEGRFPAGADKRSTDEAYWEHTLGRYWAEHDWIRVDQAARAGELISILETPEAHEVLEAFRADDPENLPLCQDGSADWGIIEQIILDPDDTGDWRLTVAFDKPATIKDNKAHVYPLSLEPY